MARFALPALLLAAALGGAPAALAADSARVSSWTEQDLKFFFDDVFTPFFSEERAADGRATMATSRERATPQRFPRVKPPKTLRIFVLGGSVAQRYMPIQSGREQAELWESFLPGQRVETINAAVPSYDSAREIPILEEVLGYSPDLVVLFSGNNEKNDPTFAATRLYKLQAPLRRLEWFRSLQEKLRRPDGGAGNLSPEEVERAFELNVTKMARMAKAKGVPLVLCTLPRNLADSVPGMMLPLQDEAFFFAWLRLDQGDLAGAERELREYVRTRPREPFGAYFLARDLRAQGRTAEARELYMRAAEFSLQNGAPPSRNARLRELAAREGAVLADVEAAFVSAAVDGLPDSALFDDNIHWHRTMNPLITLTIIRAAGGAAGARWRPEALRRELESLKALRLSAEERNSRAMTALFNGVWTWAWDKQRNDEASVAGLDLVWRLKPELLDKLLTEKGREEIRHELGRFVWVSSDIDRLDELWPLVFDNLGEMYRRRKLWPKALRAFDASLALDPGRALTRLRRSMARRAAGDLRGAAEDLDAARGRAGEFPEIGYYSRASAPSQ